MRALDYLDRQLRDASPTFTSRFSPMNSWTYNMLKLATEFAEAYADELENQRLKATYAGQVEAKEQKAWAPSVSKISGETFLTDGVTR